MRLELLATAATFLALSLAARADTVTSFILTGTLPDGSVNGTITIDTTTGLVTANDFTVIASGADYLFDIGPEQQLHSSTVTTNVSFYDSGGDFFSANFPTLSFVGYTGGILCTSCPIPGGVSRSSFSANTGPAAPNDYLTSGSLSMPSTTSVTPEPSTFLLLGTGLLTLANVARRRLAW